MTDKDTTKEATKDAPKADAPKYDPVKNPAGASDAQIRKGEMVGKVRGRDIDPSYHVYEFTDAYTGEPVETHQVIHDVPVGVNEDGSLKTEKADKVFFQQADKSDAPKTRTGENK